MKTIPLPSVDRDALSRPIRCVRNIADQGTSHRVLRALVLAAELISCRADAIPFDTPHSPLPKR